MSHPQSCKAFVKDAEIASNVSICCVVKSYIWPKLQGIRRVYSTITGSFAVDKKNSVKMYSLKPDEKWLKALYISSLISVE
jgi:hypothetical protein